MPNENRAGEAPCVLDLKVQKVEWKEEVPATYQLCIVKRTKDSTKVPATYQVPAGTMGPQVRMVNRTEDQTKLPRRSHRATVLAVLDASTTWRNTRELAEQTRLSHHQVGQALRDLHDTGQIARAGRNNLTRWGALTLSDAATAKTERPYRATVLAALSGATTWRTSHDVVEQTGLTYPQVIFALHALHNFGQIARTGRKFTARWGPLTMIESPAHNFDILQGLFHGIVKRPGLSDGDDAEKGSAEFSATPALSNSAGAAILLA